MDFMKVFDQTVREIKREVNLKVLKVPEIEQKVLDATDDEPWGPHGSALSELARATRKFTECQMIMNVLWTRLTEGSARWRHAYKALTVIEYLIANGSERAVDDILEHSSRISKLSRFEYVEPNGKDAGINVRKKVETIMNLVNDTDKIKAVREKANANRDKYVGLSSSEITNKSSSASYGSSSGRYGGYGSDDQYGSLGSSRDFDSFRSEDSYNIKEGKSSSEGLTSDNGFSKLKKGTKSRNKDSASKLSPNKGLGTSKSSSAPSNDGLGGDDLDDFDPRGSPKSGVNATANTTKAEVDLFGPNLMDDFMGAPSVATTNSATEKPDEVDLFEDADFQSAPPQPGPKSSSKTRIDVDLFSGEATFTPAFSSTTTDFFSAPELSLPPEAKAQAPMPNPISSETVDPFASIPLNNFSSDPFGDFTSNVSTTTPAKGTQNNISDPSADDSFGTFTAASTTNLSQNLGSSSAKPSNAKSSFQVKSGIWADSLSRGLIDLNITAPKKVNLADIGIVGGLDDASNEKDKFSSFGPASYLGSGPGLGLSGGGSSGGSKLSGFGQQQVRSFK